MKILVTGGAGYVGSHTAKALRRAGHEVVVYDNLSRGHRWAVRWGPLEVGDVRDEAALRSVFRRHEIEAVMHFAALAYVGESMQEPGRYFHHNAEGSMTLLRVMLEREVKQIVFSSTCATYGTPRRLPITEDTPQIPVNPYGESKRMVERAMEWYAACHGMRYAALRYFNASGDDPEGEIGECHVPETHLIPAILEAALGERPRLQVFGDDFETPDGTCVRDYVHVLDLASAHLLALDHLAGGGGNLALNLGTGQGCSVREMIRQVEEVSGVKVPVAMCPRRAGDPPVLVADATRAREVLGWTPQMSAPADIVRTAWRWHSDVLPSIQRLQWPMAS